jgi:hypothetical protein
MADWRHIQTRIRKARAAADAPAVLADLFAKTQDGMVAFELGRFHQKAEQKDEAVRWYQTAHEKFRRETWRKKAAESLRSLGVDVAEIVEPAASGSAPPGLFEDTSGPLGEREPDSLAAQPVASDLSPAALRPAEPRSDAASGAGGKRRRGRRGGRRHKRRGPGGAVAAPAAAVAPQQESQGAPPVPQAPAAPATRRESRRDFPRRESSRREPRSERGPLRESPSPPEPTSEPVGTAYLERSGRAGDPAMASHIAKLESQLRRLLACPPHAFEDADIAPAGPGVYLLSDSDQTSYYFVEACRTLRIALGQMARGRTTEGSLKRDLARHLEIDEAKVGKYLKDHCVVRWIQLDDEAARLAHFAIAVLRPALNE